MGRCADATPRENWAKKIEIAKQAREAALWLAEAWAAQAHWRQVGPARWLSIRVIVAEKPEDSSED